MQRVYLNRLSFSFNKSDISLIPFANRKGDNCVKSGKPTLVTTTLFFLIVNP